METSANVNVNAVVESLFENTVGVTVTEHNGAEHTLYVNQDQVTGELAVGQTVQVAATVEWMPQNTACVVISSHNGDSNRLYVANENWSEVG